MPQHQFQQKNQPDSLNFGRNQCFYIDTMLYKLADRLSLLKCYDNKMVKLPGCSSVEGHLHVANQQKNLVFIKV